MRMADLPFSRHHGAVRRLTTLVVLMVVATILVPQFATAGTTVRLKGGGFGHGIGMSQYGAFGMAQKGSSADKILTHYYSHTNVRAEKMPRAIRVGLLPFYGGHTDQVTISGNGKYTFKVEGADAP